MERERAVITALLALQLLLWLGFLVHRAPQFPGSLTGTLTKDSRWPEGDFRNLYFRPHNLMPTLDAIDANTRRTCHGVRVHPPRGDEPRCPDHL